MTQINYKALIENAMLGMVKGILKKIQYAIDNNNILFLNIQSLDILDIDTLNSVNELLHDLTYIDLE